MGPGMLLGMWDDDEEVLTVRRPNGQTYRANGGPIKAAGGRVLGVVTVGNEVHVLVGGSTNQRPNRRVKFNDAGVYKGSSGL